VSNEMSSRRNLPGQKARVNNQGSAETCSLMSVAKAVANGFHTKKFHDDKIDLKQDCIKTALLTITKDEKTLEPKHPTAFDGKTIAIQDQISHHWKIILFVTAISMNDFILDTKTSDTRKSTKSGKKKSFEHLIVTNLGNGPHCMYVSSFDYKTDTITCMNSWGESNNPKPMVKVGNVINFYRVSARADGLDKDTDAEEIADNENDPEWTTVSRRKKTTKSKSKIKKKTCNTRSRGKYLSRGSSSRMSYKSSRSSISSKMEIARNISDVSSFKVDSDDSIEILTTFSKPKIRGRAVSMSKHQLGNLGRKLEKMKGNARSDRVNRFMDDVEEFSDRGYCTEPN